MSLIAGGWLSVHLAVIDGAPALAALFVDSRCVGLACHICRPACQAPVKAVVLKRAGMSFSAASRLGGPTTEKFTRDEHVLVSLVCTKLSPKGYSSRMFAEKSG